MPVANKLHVVTYVWRPGDDDPDVLAHQVLENPADPKAGVEGDATKVVLSQTQNHQCNGEHGTDGCNKVHAHAEERVIARFVGEDKVAVVWRKYHPLAAKGAVRPGEPFEAEHDGLKVRVEARVVTDEPEEVITPKAVSMVGLRALEAKLQKQHQLHQEREKLREAVKTFVDGPLAQTRQQLADIRERVKDLPGAKKTMPGVEQAIDDVEQAVQNELAELLKKDDCGAVDLRAITLKIQTETPKLALALAPAQQLERDAAQLVRLQQQIRDLIRQIDGVETAFAHHRKTYGGLDVKALPHADLKGDAEQLLEDTRTDENLALADATRRLQDLTPRLAARTAALNDAVAAEQPKKRAFDDRRQRLVDLKNGTLAKDLDDYVEACGVGAGFNVKHWRDKVSAAVAKAGKDAPDVGALAYHAVADQKALAAAEKKVAPLMDVLKQLDADVKKRVPAPPVHNVRGQQLVPPSVWIKSTDVKGDDAIDVVVNVRNNGAHALLVDIKNEDGSVVHQSVALGKKGERATFSLAGVGKKFTATVTAVGPEVERGARAQLSRCVVSTGAVLGIEGKGSVRHFAPHYFTPSPQQPNDAVAHVFQDEPGVTLSRQRVPGEE